MSRRCKDKLPPSSTYVNELVPPTLEIPALILVNRIVEPVPIEDIEENVVVKLAGSRAYRWRTVSYWLHLS